MTARVNTRRRAPVRSVLEAPEGHRLLSANFHGGGARPRCSMFTAPEAQEEELTPPQCLA
jgi:hypothetical protein